jgi:hypothetical protein
MASNIYLTGYDLARTNINDMKEDAFDGIFDRRGGRKGRNEGTNGQARGHGYWKQ